MSNIEIQSFYDLEDLNENEIKSLGLQPLFGLLEDAKSEQKELNTAYHNGDSLRYPPDWYDQYVFPIDCIINKIEDAIESLNNEEESEEDSY